MRYLITTILLALAALSWGEKSFFCTLERTAFVDNAMQSSRSINQQLVLIATLKILTVKLHTPKRTGLGDKEYKVLSYSNELIVAGNHSPAQGIFLTWIIDAKHETVLTSDMTNYNNTSSAGTCTKF